MCTQLSRLNMSAIRYHDLVRSMGCTYSTRVHLFGYVNDLFYQFARKQLFIAHMKITYKAKFFDIIFSFCR